MWPNKALGASTKRITTGYPVIVVVISVVIEKKTAACISIFGSTLVNKKGFAASTMTGKLTGQSYSEKSIRTNKVIEILVFSRIFTGFNPKS